MGIFKQSNQLPYTEPLDRNKSELTHAVTACAMIFLENRGFKPIETEVFAIGFGIVDIGGACTPSPTDTKKLRLSNAEKYGCEKTDIYNHIQFRYGPILTAAIEVKVTRQDFLKDVGNKFQSRKERGDKYIYPAHLCYLAFPKGLIEEHEIPMGWMGLEMDSSGSRLLRKYWTYPEIHPQNPGDLVWYIMSLAIRADYRTRYARQRIMMKMYRANK